MSVLDAKNVIDWNGRPRRAFKKPPPTYWEEYVETDEWYKKALVDDVPDEEMWAAVDDDELDDEGEEGDSEVDSDEEDDDFIPMEVEEDEVSSSETEGDEASEGESGGEGSDGEGESGTVGEERPHSFQSTDEECQPTMK